MTTAATESHNFRASITRLAQFRPGGAGQLQIEAMVRELLLTSAYEAGESGIDALAGFRDTCLALWGIETEIDELRALVEVLIGEGKLAKHKNSYRLTEEARAELQEQISNNDQTEGEAFADWEVALKGIAARVDSPAGTGDLRVALVASQMTGMFVTRHLLRIDALRALTTERTVRLIAPTLQRYLTGPLEPN